MKKYRLTIILILLLAITSIVSIFIGVIDISVGDIFNDSTKLTILLKSRIPRLLAILCTGMGLSIAGLIMQKLCANKFVSPTTGATISGAQLGILIALIAIPSSSLLTKSALAFVTALAGTWIFVFFITKIKFKDTIMVPLIGIMFSNVIGGVTSYIAYKFDATQTLSSYLTGSFSGVIMGRYEIVFLVVPLIIIAVLFANHFNIVGLGQDFSKNLGINYRLVLIIGLSICAMITASIVVVVGSISYIGLIIPNIIVMFKGDRLKGTLMQTALCGALFVLICDIIGRIVIFPYELPIELIIGIVGSILFIGLIIYKMKYGNKSIKLFNKGAKAYEE